MGGHHHHHDYAGEGLVNAAREALTVAGEQWTGMRADVFAALVAQPRPASAYDIAEHVGQARGKRVAPNSVYRILDLFVRTNLARRVERECLCGQPHPGCRHDCIFLICDACGQATHLDDDRLTGLLREAARDAGFADVRPVVEIAGAAGPVGRCRTIRNYSFGSALNPCSRLSGQGRWGPRACSYQREARSTSMSAKRRPTIWSPIGSPSAL
jgi:Fur family zinc uptake transcriptional regulator